MAANNVLALPRVQMTVETGNNEDWIDSILYLVASTGAEEPTQLDLRGIDFLMQVRRAAEDHEVVLSASSRDGTISIGGAPNYGFMIINIPVDDMRAMRAGDYVADMVASAATFTRVCIQMAITIVEGVSAKNGYFSALRPVTFSPNYASLENLIVPPAILPFRHGGVIG